MDQHNNPNDWRGISKFPKETIVPLHRTAILCLSLTPIQFPKVGPNGPTSAWDSKTRSVKRPQFQFIQSELEPSHRSTVWSLLPCTGLSTVDRFGGPNRSVVPKPSASKRRPNPPRTTPAKDRGTEWLISAMQVILNIGNKHLWNPAFISSLGKLWRLTAACGAVASSFKQLDWI